APTATLAAKAVDLVTNKRSIKSTVLADDGQVIVLGGLIQDDLLRSDSRVPLLGDIPGVGRLFRSSRET
ncbi:type II secretion system protein GspD, partial [Pseudomonas aeruginosa]|nr:type II secretion system protein GspD [Pseudomonas aeruginosa]